VVQKSKFWTLFVVTFEWNNHNLENFSCNGAIWKAAGLKPAGGLGQAARQLGFVARGYVHYPNSIP